MSSNLSSVHLPTVMPLWPRARRLLALASVAAAGIGGIVALILTGAPHALAAGAVHLQSWVTGLSQLDVFLGLVALFVVAVAVAVVTAIDYDNKRELFDVR